MKNKIDLNKEKLTALAFNIFSEISSKKLFFLLSSFKSLSAVYRANFTDLKRAGLEDSLASKFLAWRSNFEINPVLEFLNKENINFCSYFDEYYPKILKEIHNPPLLLYFKGCMKFNESLSLSVVGSRVNSLYGEKVVDEIIRNTCDYGITIISGLALGIDSIAHLNFVSYLP